MVNIPRVKLGGIFRQRWQVAKTDWSVQLLGSVHQALAKIRDETMENYLRAGCH